MLPFTLSVTDTWPEYFSFFTREKSKLIGGGMAVRVMMGNTHTFWKWIVSTESILFKTFGTVYYYPNMIHRELTPSAGTETRGKPKTPHPGKILLALPTQGPHWCLEEHPFRSLAWKMQLASFLERNENGSFDRHWAGFIDADVPMVQSGDRIEIPFHSNAVFGNLGRWEKHVENSLHTELEGLHLNQVKSISNSFQLCTG